MSSNNDNVVMVEVDRRKVTLADGTAKTIPAIFSSYKDDGKQFEALERFVRGNGWASAQDKVIVVS